MCGPRGASAACEPGYTQFVYMDNKDYLEAKCGSNDVVAQFLHCTGQMEATVLGSSQLQGQCWLRFTPRLAVGRLRPLVGFPCSVFTYEGAGASAETAGPLDLRVNTSGLCEWKATVNASSPAANEFSPMCNPRLTPQQQQAAVLGRCLSPPRFKAEADLSASSAADATMARTIGLAVGMVLLAAGLGVGIAWYLVTRARRSGGGGGGGGVMGLWGGNGGGGGGMAGIGRIGGGPLGGRGRFDGGWGAAGRGAGAGGPGLADGDPAAAAYSNGGPPAGGAGGAQNTGMGMRLPVHVRQPPLEQQLQGQQQRQAAAAAAAAGGQPQGAAAAGLPPGALAAGTAQPRVHHWRPLAPRPSGRESPFASLLEEEGDATPARGLPHPPQPEQRPPDAAAVVLPPSGLSHARHRG